MQRPLYFAAGLTSMAVGTVGAFLPVLPTVPFFLLAAFCFARSSPEWEAHLLRRPRWGPPILDWRERRAISRKAKLAALATLGISGYVAVLTLAGAWLAMALNSIVVAGGWIATRAE